jgi:hypothetical protein
MEEVREWVAQCHGMTQAFPHSTGGGRTTRVGGTAPGYDSRRCQRAGVVGISPLTRAPATYWGI